MKKQTMGQIISELRKKQGMTQLELAEKLAVTDKAVSKWERDLSRPDVASLPKLAQTLDIPVEELLAGTAKNPAGEHEHPVDIVLRALPVAMGVALVVLGVLDALTVQLAAVFAGIGIGCLAIRQLKTGRN